MELGEKLRQARLAAGMSQRQLCGDRITRNMLSLIENGSASPSMETLRYLAARLGKNVSFFLEETAVVSVNQETISAARRLFDAGDNAAALSVLEEYREPDEVYDREKQLLWVSIHLRLAEEAIRQGRFPYAASLLEKADKPTAYCREDLERRRLLLFGRIPGNTVSPQLPSLDEELLLRATEALAYKDTARAEPLLDAVQDQSQPQWALLRGEAYLARQNYRAAARCYHAAESAYPAQTAPRLEQCYQALKDYKRAYEYACKQRPQPWDTLSR